MDFEVLDLIEKIIKLLQTKEAKTDSYLQNLYHQLLEHCKEEGIPCREENSIIYVSINGMEYSYPSKGKEDVSKQVSQIKEEKEEKKVHERRIFTPTIRNGLIKEELRTPFPGLCMHTFTYELPKKSIFEEAKHLNICCAPFAISLTAVDEVPIMVAGFTDNYETMVTHCSFEQEKVSGMIRLDILDYSFLLSGSFDEEGFFLANIRPIGEKTKALKQINSSPPKELSKLMLNGHLRFTYTNAEDIKCLFDIFPLEWKKGAFLGIEQKEKEITYYLLLPPRLGGFDPVVLETDEGHKTLVALWNSDGCEAILSDL